MALCNRNALQASQWNVTSQCTSACGELSTRLTTCDLNEVLEAVVQTLLDAPLDDPLVRTSLIAVGIFFVVCSLPSIYPLVTFQPPVLLDESSESTDLA